MAAALSLQASFLSGSRSLAVHVAESLQCCQPIAICLLLAVLTMAPLHAANLVPDMPLSDALEELRAEGLTVIYSSDLVAPWMRISTVPSASKAPEVLQQLLQPWGLTTQAGPNGSLLVVREARPQATGELAGVVIHVLDRTPLVGATVSLGDGGISTVTDARGQFLLTGLAPGRYRLRVDYESATYARRIRTRIQSGQTTSVVLEMDGLKAAALDELVVNASRYQFMRGPGLAYSEFSATNLELNPDVGDDPMRALSRLPGMTGNDFSARSYVRGGQLDENLVRLDGLRLYNPYHLKDFNGLFSSVDSRLVDRMDVHAGGFPASYGDRMSSVVDIQTVRPEQDFYGEVTASFFNLSTLYSGYLNNRATNWLVSGRRGNLDMVLDVVDPKLGNPQYYDTYARLGHVFNDSLEVTGNFLLSDDNIDISDSDEEEFSEGDHRDQYYWLRFDLSPRDDLIGNMLVARTRLSTRRHGTVFKEGASAGFLQEDNHFRIDSVQTDWSWWFSDDQMLQFGGEYRDQKGSYSYQDQADFALLLLTPGAQTNPAQQNLRSTDAAGSYVAVYTALRTRLTDKLTNEFGLRWNKETLSVDEDESLDPRLSLLYEFTALTRGRLSAGRFSQSQTIDELDYADIDSAAFFPLEHVDQIVASLEHDIGAGVTVRGEVYYKDYDDLRPRFENFLDNYSLVLQLWPDRVEIDAARAEVTGVELSIAKADTEPWNWWLSYVWSTTEDNYSSGDIRRSWDQRHSVGAGLTWQTDRWDFSMAGNWHTGWPTTSTELAVSDPFPLISVAKRNDQNFKNYLNIDARVARKFQFDGRDRLTVFLEVHNLLNRDNDCCTLYEVTDEDGELEYDTDVEGQIPVFPSLGFIWQF